MVWGVGSLNYITGHYVSYIRHFCQDIVDPKALSKVMSSLHLGHCEGLSLSLCFSISVTEVQYL